MNNHGKMITARSVLALSLGILALALLAPVAANAQVTVRHVVVTVGPVSGPGVTALYCDTGTTCPGGVQVWNLGAGITLTGTQTLVLTQTGTVPVIIDGGAPGGNFDTSDRVRANQPTAVCSSTSPCAVTIQLDTGSGLTTVYSNSGPNPINGGNADTGALNHHEEAAYQQVFAAANYTLSIGYADNEHGCPPPIGAPNCFPNPFNGTLGTTPATVFIGAGLGASGFCPTTTPPNCFDAGVLLITGINVVRSLPGRMTGGGSVFTTAGVRVTHGFELHCDRADLPNNLEINWDGGNNFHLTTLTSVTCIDNPAIAPQPPNAGFDTYIATGLGTCNGLPAAISFVLTDAGEPGTKDTAQFNITGGCTLTVSGKLDKGNQQAHND
ncbi:MAG: hypothetical protein DMG14_16825 [Acidobacteria bacterium]|nr:MAG: hypothetical protein DMG14_16825 [Acidobacteriota bacterium]